MTPKDIYIFRHGETEWNKIGRCLGSEYDIPLNENGVQQARNLASAMKRRKLDTIYTSPLLRAYQTAEFVNEFHQVPLLKYPGLTEMAYGDASGLPRKEAEEKFGNVFSEWFGKDLKDSLECGFPNGEAKGIFNDRIYKCISSLSAQSSGDTIAIATHSGVIWNFFKYQLGITIDKINYCEAHILKYTDGIFKYEGVCE
jgi:broad specificity phosphatase PhoE